MSPAEQSPVTDAPGFAKIDHFIVLMLENRSFDHLLGALSKANSKIDGLNPKCTNYDDPRYKDVAPVTPVSRATTFAMPFDPGHEFDDVDNQIFGPFTPQVPEPPMSGFVYSAAAAAGSEAAARKIMECFEPDQVPVLCKLAMEFAVFNAWHASVPGPTWPNRFFVHAGTSGGLTDSPGTGQVLAGYSFENGTIFDRIADAGKQWRIYHDDLPQAAGIDSLRDEYINIFTKNFREFSNFTDDLNEVELPDYVFIEPKYDTGNNYQNGNSMHPLNDVRKGEALVQTVYEALRKSRYWPSTMLIITFDEHGGFYDHVPPPQAVAPGDDSKYSTVGFDFTRLGVRVPAVVVSPFTPAGTVIDSDLTFDHTSILATLEKRWNMPPLTARDAAANTLDLVCSLPDPRPDAPLHLVDVALPMPIANALPPDGWENLPLTEAQKTATALALRVHMDIEDQAQHPRLKDEHAQVTAQGDVGPYLETAVERVRDSRQSE